MLTRKTQYGWIVLAGILCLCGAVVALKIREGEPAAAQVAAPQPPAPAAQPDAPPPSEPKTGFEITKTSSPPPAVPPPAAPQAPPPALADPPPPAPPPLDPPALPPAVAVPPGPPPASPPPPLPPIDPPAPAKPVMDNPPPLPAPEPKEPRAPEPTPPVGHLPPAWNDPVQPPVIQASQVGEPPLAGMGPLQAYRVHANGETMRDIARHALGTGERCTEVYKLNPALHPEDVLAAGTVVHLPPDACLPADEIEGVKPLPAMRPTTAPARPKSVMALTGTYPCNLDDKRTFTLPRAVRDQFGDADLVLVSPGPDQCLWLTDQAHQERLADRLEHSPAREVDVRVFKRLYYAQTEKLTVGADGRVTLSDRLAQFAGLSQEMVLVGIDDHFEVWDAARWKQYTQAKSAVLLGSE
ncbi:MAG TPA: hypothetical protein VMS17_32645 [Gemmataceae bacterium]|nr:hypothetical protein [Gemmataceae bacterium]